MAHTRPELLTTTDQPVRVLLVDDDEDDYKLTLDVMNDIPGNRYTLDWVADISSAEEIVCSEQHEVCLVDYRLGPRTGLDLLKSVRNRGCSIPIILLTGLNQPNIDKAAEAAGAADFIVKSQLDPVHLERTLRYTLRQHAQERILEQKVAQRTAELVAANVALAEADRRKDEYLAVLAHELRNPLAPIRNALEIMRLSVDRPNALEKARNMIDRQIALLIRLIDDLLDVSRFTRDKLSLNQEVLELSEPLSMAIEATQSIIEQKKLTFRTEINRKAIKIEGDRVRLAQLFSQLLNNAAKYTESPGHIILKVDHVILSDRPLARIQVIDTGVGISAQHLPNVFDLFCQIDQKMGRNQAGLGIGLAFAKKLAQLHSGDLIAESTGEGQGSTFSLLLPMI